MRDYAGKEYLRSHVDANYQKPCILFFLEIAPAIICIGYIVWLVIETIANMGIK